MMSPMCRMQMTVVVTLTWVLAATGCGGDDATSMDGGMSRDGGAGTPDASVRDATVRDATTPDGGALDASVPDAGASDGGEMDAGETDAGAEDGGAPLCADTADGGGVFTCERATTCSGDLSAVGTADFSIAFRVTTTTPVRSGVIGQRLICMHSHFWDVRMGPTSFGVELDDPGGVYTSFTVPVALNDGDAHDVQICRKTGRVGVFIDGCLITLVDGATNLSGLAPLTTMTTTCTAYDGTQPLDGVVDDVCVGPLP